MTTAGGDFWQMKQNTAPGQVGRFTAAPNGPAGKLLRFRMRAAHMYLETCDECGEVEE